MRHEFPTLEALIKLSEKAPIAPDVEATLRQRGPTLARRVNLGFVVIDSRFISRERADLVVTTLRLREVERDRHLTLYEPIVDEP
jgi:hypothetical protein